MGSKIWSLFQFRYTGVEMGNQASGCTNCTQRGLSEDFIEVDTNLAMSPPTTPIEGAGKKMFVGSAFDHHGEAMNLDERWDNTPIDERPPPPADDRAVIDESEWQAMLFTVQGLAVAEAPTRSKQGG